MTALRTRIAPTPSGYLHLGNAWSFLLTWLYARKAGGYVHLRIDDIDPERYRDAYAQDIFDSLRWLGLDYDGGPESATDFFSQRRLHEIPSRYREALRALAVAPNHTTPQEEAYLFACDCSRESIKRALAAQGHAGLPGRLYPGTCRHRRLDLQALIHHLDLSFDLSLDARTAPDVAIRWHVPVDASVTVHDLHLGQQTLYPGREVGDVVVRTRTGGFAYHLTSVADDQALGMNFIVRGEDLLPSTGVQMAMAVSLGYSNFTDARFVHHPLVLRNGAKLSKSEGAESLKSMRERGLPATAIYRYFATTLSLPKEAGETLHSLLQAFPGESAHLPKHPLAFEHFEE